MKAFVVAGTQSGTGKTTVSLALMAALRRRGLKTAAFKVGPDFIDPGHHAQIIGRPSHNLDGWMLSREENQQIFRRWASGADAVVVEGVMGLYDGYDGLSEAGSTAQMAKWLGLPVLLCVDSRSMARSLGAVALGFYCFDPDLTWAGILANRVGSDRHLMYLEQALSTVPSLTFRGGLRRKAEIALPERHLGLVTAEESQWEDEAVSRLADWIEDGFDLDRLWADLPVMSLPDPEPESFESPQPRARIGVARDEAFCFYYHENFRRLEQAGAELVFFSPLRDERLPANLDGLYFGGGYPELFAAQLSKNYRMREDVLRLGQAGRPVYAECGGFMYLGRRLGDLEGRSWPMTGLLPVEVTMLDRLKSLGYRQVVLREDTPLGPAGTRVRGHEFHYSEVARADSVHSVYDVEDKDGRMKDVFGYLAGNVLASYVHLHFGSNPQAAQSFVDACQRG